ncbi:TetR/AcrR family transcriptional regulator [Mucilaginibacter sp. P25]|uniref:DNA-binding transcriptional regulator, AcrR family n=1 Tax=Mucilaginibacter gossypii TaxID=551996 RepID=A0A1G8BT17_9SPHI|nr:TetR/AcrR family transcriptional regulator [Mucilaginibacter gossypii]SDH36302.1 DNA-binding transcriptional regulator, AcrR family [Mucilaginibacter gossypii]
MEDKRKRLIDITIELFINHGIISVTMDDVAKAAGMSKKTVYQCFANKGLLVEAVVHQLIGQSKSIISSNTNAADDPVQELVLQQGLFKHLIALRHLFNDTMLKRYPRAMKAFHEFKINHLKIIIESNLADGIAMGLYRTGLDVPATAAIYISVADFYLFNNTGKKTADIFEALQLFINGIITDDGRRLLADYTK